MSGLIKEVRDHHLCVSCGTCAGVCPTGAVEMVRDPHEHIYLPKVEDEKCVGCGLCGQVCPGRVIDFDELNNLSFDPDNIQRIVKDDLIGYYLGCYRGHSEDQDIRYESTSGGITCSLLIYMLERGMIDGAIVIRMRRDQPLETDAVLAKTRDEIIASSRSKYCPTSPNILLKDILQGEGRYALVGLPCQLHGIRKAEKLNPQLKERIVLHIGLMCSHTVNYAGTELVLEKLGIHKDEVSSISYRGYGWPGGMNVTTLGGEKTSIPLFGAWRSYWPVFSSFFFTPLRCIMCPDQTAELADISMGDAWLKEASGDRTGESVMVTRTMLADELVEKMTAEKIITSQSIPPGKIIESQELNLKFKKKDLDTRLKLLGLLGYEIPRYSGLPGSKFSVFGAIRATYAWVNLTLSKYRLVRLSLRYIPFPFFRLYFGIYKVLSKI